MIERRTTPVERLVDRALSLSSVSHGGISERADDLAREVREAMACFARDGLVTEVVESEALIARRTAPAWPEQPIQTPPASRPSALTARAIT